MNLDILNKQIKDEGKKFSLENHRGLFKIRGTFIFQNGIKKRSYLLQLNSLFALPILVIDNPSNF